MLPPQIRVIITMIKMILNFIFISTLCGFLRVSLGLQEFINIHFTHEPQDVLVVRGQSVRFDCGYNVKDSLRSLVTVTWYRNDQILSRLDHKATNRVYLLFNNSLYIAKTVQTETEQPDIGTYHCALRVSSIGTMRSRVATLSFAYVSSTFTLQPEDKEAALNDTVVFHCEIDRLPRIDLVWYYSENLSTLPYRVSDRLADQATLHQQGSYLEIRVTTGREFGLYRCDAVVPGGRGFVHSRPARLSRRAPAQLPELQRPSLWFEASPPARLEASERQPLALVCAANARFGGGDGGPSVQLEWLRGSASLRPSKRLHHVGQGSLLIDSVVPSDAGIYVCRASAGDWREIYTQTELTVLTPPRFADGDLPADAVAFAGGDAALRCEARGNPEPSITWVKDAAPLAAKPPFVQRLGRELRLRGLQESDAGLYQCLVSSSAGNQQRLAQLLVLDAASKDAAPVVRPLDSGDSLPASPSNLRYYQLGTDFCHLEWSAPPQPPAATAAEHGAWDSFIIELFPEDSTRRLSFVTRETGYIISGLQANSAYTVRVSSQTRQRARSRPVIMTFRTERAAPTPAPVTGLRAMFINSTVLQIAWDPLPAAGGSCSVLQILLRDQTTQSDQLVNASCSPLHFHILDVRPHRYYRVLASALDTTGARSHPAMLSLLTPSSRPDQSPENLTISVTSTGALLAWLPPPLPSRNGVLVGYRIRYRELAAGSDRDGEEGRAGVTGAVTHKVTVPGDQLTHLLAGLAPFTRYAAQVAAKTVNGTGRFTRWIPFDTRPDAHRYQSAKLRDPGEQPGDVSLPEKIQVKSSQVTVMGKRDSILLSWSRPSSVVIPDKYQIYYGTQLPKEKLAGEISGDQDAYQIRNLQPNKSYFITIVAIKDGVPAETTLHERTQHEAHDRQAPSVPLRVDVTVLDSRTVVVSWTDRDRDLPGAEAAGRVYEVEWAEDASAGGPGSPPPPPSSLNTSALRLRIPQLRPFTTYSARVRCHLGYMLSDYSLRAIFVTKPEAPSSPPLDLKASRTGLPKSVMLSWLPPLEANGRIIGYTVYYTDDGPGRKFVSRKTAPKETQIVLTGMMPSTLYLFKVQAENQEGVGPATNLTTFMTPDANGYGGGMVLDAISGSSQSDSPVQSASPTDLEGDRKLWFVIGGGFGLAILLLVVAIATVCVCRGGGDGAGLGARRRRQAERLAKEEASLIGQEAIASQRHLGSPRARSGKSSPDTQAAALLASTAQQQHQQQQTPDLCRRSDNCLELRHLPQAGRGSDGPVGGGAGPFGRTPLHPHLSSHLGHGGRAAGTAGFGDSLLIDPGASPNPSAHFRNISSSGLYPPGTPPFQFAASTAAAAAASTAASRGLASPPRVDAPDFSSGKLSSPHSSLSSSVGSPSKRNPAASGSLMLASLGNSRINATPDILNPVGRPARSLQGAVGGGGVGGGSTFDSQTSRSLVLSTEDMTKTLDGLMNDLRSLTNKEFEC